MNISHDDSVARGILRHTITTQRPCQLGVIDFKKLVRKDHVARLVNLSVIGVGIESAERIEPGVIWFKELVGGHRFGVLAWSRKTGDRYRAGIRFLSLSRSQEQYLQEQMNATAPAAPLKDPRRIIASMIESLRQDLGSRG